MGGWVDSDMVRYMSLILFIGFAWGQRIDELENLYKHKKRFLFQRENIYKSKGIWYSENSDEPFTGRLEIYSRKLKEFKVAECTFVDGVKNGFFIQYYHSSEMLPGIMGLYINDKKEGAWTWIEPDINYENQAWEDSDLKIITSIDYRDGIKHGSIIVHKANLGRFGYVQNYSYPRQDMVLQGQYSNGEKTGQWYYSDYTKDITMMSFYWSRKHIYKKDNLIDSECRAPWGKKIDCEAYEQNNLGKIYILSPLDKSRNKTIDIKMGDIVVIQDNDGIDVEIDIKEFVYHINKYHHSVVSIHTERGHYFTVNDNFRKMLNKKIGTK